MNGREPVWRRALRLVRPDAARDVDEELAFHLTMREADYVARGATPEQARQLARERFGDLGAARDACVRVGDRRQRSALRLMALEELGQDLRLAVRTLVRRPAFAVTVMLTLAVGIGGTTGIFALINAVLLQPPAQVQNPGALVALFTSDYSGPAFGGNSHPDYESFREASDVLALAAYDRQQVSVVLRGVSQLRNMEMVSGNYFDVLGVSVQHGRTISPGEDGEPGNHPVVVLSDLLWRRALDADPNVVGQSIRLNGQLFTVIGVAAPRFTGVLRGSPADLWIPRSMSDALFPGSHDLTHRDNRGIRLIGRLKPGATVALAQARMQVVADGLFAAYPDLWRDVTGKARRITVVAEKDARISPDARGRVVGFLSLLMAAVTLLLLLCSANVATLLLIRGAARGREIAVRLSLGAGRARLVRQLLVEHLVLAVLGGVAGLWVAQQVTRGLLAMLSAGAGDFDAGMGGPVLVFAFVVTLGSGLLVGLAPALRSTRTDIERGLKGDWPGTRIGRRRVALRDVLVSAQVALSLLLLTGAGLVLKGLRSAQQTDVGFERRGLLLVQPLALQGYDGPRAREYYRMLTERIGVLPGVSGSALANVVPLGGGGSRQTIRVEGYQPRAGEDMEYGSNRTSPGYFRLMGIPLAQGRDFADADREGAAAVAIVNETFARRFWPGENALGKRLGTSSSGEQWATVVGVARDIDYNRVGEESRPYFYLPYAQSPSRFMSLHVRASGDEQAVLASVAQAARGLDSDVPVNALSMDERVGRALAPQRTAAALLALLGGVGLLLAGTGLYGVLTFAVAQRTREFGIRMALGATATRVRRMVVRQGVVLASVGVVVGLAAAAGLARLASGVLFGVSPTDPATFVGVAMVLLAVAATASWLPARRATAVNPADIIRQD